MRSASRRRFSPLQIDAAIAVLVALIAIIAAPGLAITALLALLVLVLCGITLAMGRLRERRSQRRGRGQPPVRRVPPGRV